VAPVQPPAFGELLKAHRLASNLTQEALAERARISVRAISDLERGLHRTPQKDTVHLLADALQLSTQDRAAFEAAARRLADSSAPRLRM
jgi:transcriptional regulator with XRE-family HTH domain